MKNSANSSKPVAISSREARRLALHHQGLLRPDHFGRGINAVQRAIEQLHYVQIDTISVVERAHHHVLQNRVSNYTHDMLHKLHSEKAQVFEYWSHAAAYLPMADYRFYLPMMRGYAERRKTPAKLRREILARIKDQGSAQARDFENKKGGNNTGWWDWKPAKRAMETMFLSGELMVKQREGFRKIYDLTENVLPAHIDTAIPDMAERGQFYVRRLLQSHGVASAREIAYARTTVRHFSGDDIRPCIDKAIEGLLESREIIALGINDETLYCPADALGNLPARLTRRPIQFLSPFDNLVINRRRLLNLFGFDYQIECYVPAAKRRYGYFTLPMLYGDSLIGRMDCKADRKQGTLLVHNIWLEAATKITDALLEDLQAGLTLYSEQLGCSNYQISKCTPGEIKPRIIAIAGVDCKELNPYWSSHSSL